MAAIRAVLRSMRWSAALVLAALFLAAAAGGAAAATQRMVIAPGCYHLSPGQSIDADAYCLDRLQPAPASGTVMTGAPETLGETIVTVAGMAPVPLQAAIDLGLIQVDGVGAGDFNHLRLKNLTGKAIEICVMRPSVMTQNQGDSIGDLARIYDKIVSAVPPADAQRSESASNADPDQHALIQEKLWDATAKQAQAEVTRRAVEEVSRSLGVLGRPKSEGTAAAAPAERPRCTPGADGLAICMDR